MKPKLTKIVKTTKTSVNFMGEKKKVTKLSIKLEEDEETVSPVELEERDKRKADKLSLSSDQKKSKACNFMKIGVFTSRLLV